jgi:hypothetical protein
VEVSSSSSMAEQPDIGPWPPLSSPSIPLSPALRVEVQLTAPAFLASALDIGEWSAPRPHCSSAGEKAPGAH